MKKSFGRNFKALAFAALTVFSGVSFISCDDEVDQENRYTFKGELISTYLTNNEDRFSNFIYILEKAKIGRDATKSGSVLKTLSTYGSYTCFAPVNEAVEAYLQEQYEKWQQGERTGIHSPYLEDLSDSMALEIAKNHIIEKGYRTTEVSEGAFPQSTMNRRFTTVEFIPNEEGRVYPVLNNSARIVEQDLEKENGYVHVIDAALNPSNKNSHELLGGQPSFSLFSSAIMATGLDKLLSVYELEFKDENGNVTEYDGTLPGEIFSNKPGRPRRPEDYKQRFTLLAESNDLLADPTKNHLGISITTLEDLERLAAEWYGHEAPGEHYNPKNALYKFIAYHIIDRQLLYSSSTGCGGFIMENYDHEGFNSEVNLPTTFDRYDYFETMLPYTMIKVTKPFTNTTPYLPYGASQPNELKQEIVINYAQDMGTRCKNPDMKYYINVVVERLSTTKKRPGLEEFDQNAINGIIHSIDRILIYNEDEMVGNILHERMRWDASSLFPELTNNNVRWFPYNPAEGKAGECFYLPKGFCSRLRTNNEQSKVFYLRPHKTSLSSYSTFMGDELLVAGKYDFQYRLPHVPTGNYEIRFGFSQNEARGVVQIYLDGKICGIPLSMLREENRTYNIIGWYEEDAETPEETKREGDKAMRNQGWMKGPASCHLGDDKNSMRECSDALRRIIGTFRLENGIDHWIRFKDVTEDLPGKYNEFSQDYLEIVPTSVVNDPAKPEDRL